MIAPGAVPFETAGRTIAADRPTSTTVTAEIPAVPAGSAYGVLLPDGTVWYPGSNKKIPAPAGLRATVWILVFVTILAAAGVVIVRLHPGWLSPLRHVVPSSAQRFTPAGGGQGGTSASKAPSGTAGRGAVAAPSVKLAAPQPAGLPNGVSVYDVSVSSYAVRVAASHATWVADYSLTSAGAGTYPLDQTTLQGGGTKYFFANGPLAVQVAAGLATVEVYAGGKKIGTAAHATPWIFWFEPKTAGSG